MREVSPKGETVWEINKDDFPGFPLYTHILNINIPSTMDGRVMNEFLRKPAPDAITKAKKETIETTAGYPGGTYTLTMERTILGKYQYVDGAKTVRK